MAQLIKEFYLINKRTNKRDRVYSLTNLYTFHSRLSSNWLFNLEENTSLNLIQSEIALLDDTDNFKQK